MNQTFKCNKAKMIVTEIIQRIGGSKRQKHDTGKEGCKQDDDSIVAIEGFVFG
jgi:hypothetical protein